MPPMPENPPMQEPPAQDFGGDMGQEQPPVDNGSGESEYDTNFDAGVEADEDEDPKKFIQQLTGKLSQELNKYNNENGDDEELSKYVGKMIAKAAAKGLDEKGRKELIKSINTAEPAEDTEMGDEGNEEEVDVDIENPEGEGGEEVTDIEQEQPIQECAFSKDEILRLAESVKVDVSKKENKEKKKSPFNPKSFD